MDIKFICTYIEVREKIYTEKWEDKHHPACLTYLIDPEKAGRGEFLLVIFF